MKFNLTVSAGRRHYENSTSTLEYTLMNRQALDDWEVTFDDRDTMIEVLSNIILKDKHDA